MALQRRVGDLLPSGGGLDDARWRLRHRLLLALLAAHIPALALIAAVNSRPVGRTGLELAALGAALAGGAVLGRRRAATLVTTLGLMVSSSVVVDVTGGTVESQLHVFVMLGFVALYQSWSAYLTAVALALGGLAAADVLGPRSGAEASLLADPWRWGTVHVGFLLFASLSYVLFWRIAEQEQAGARESYRQLYEGERAVVAQLREAERVKSELVSVVSHELRTPLTSILGFAQTLEARIDQMDRRTVMSALASIERQAHRLERIVRNLLLASGDVHAVSGATADLNAVAAAVVKELAAFPGTGSKTVIVDVEPGLAVRMDAAATSQVLLNLLDNALKFAAPDTQVRVSGRRVGQTAVLEVSNVGPAIDDSQLERIFSPFVQADSSDTRSVEGIGLGLAVARELVEAYGGRVEARNAQPWVVFVVTLPAADVEAPPLVALGPR